MRNGLAKVAARLLDLLSRLSYSSLYRVSAFFCFVLYRIIGYRQEVVHRNLTTSFPDKTMEEIRQTTSRFYRHLTDVIFETIKCRTCPKEDILARVVGDISLVDQLYAERKNVLILMGHRGNWELANLFASLRFSHECLVVYRPLSNPVFDQWFLDLRTRFGARLIPMNAIAAELRKPRNKPYAVVLANDQAPPPEPAYWTTFLHQDTGFFRGGEVLARRNSLEVLYADFSRIQGRRGFYAVVIRYISGAANPLPKNKLLDTQIRMLEQDIIAQPFNWLWSHRRWKHPRPVLTELPKEN